MKLRSKRQFVPDVWASVAEPFDFGSGALIAAFLELDGERILARWQPV